MDRIYELMSQRQDIIYDLGIEKDVDALAKLKLALKKIEEELELLSAEYNCEWLTPNPF